MEKEWYFTLKSEVFGTEEFGPYTTRREAESGIRRIKKAAERLKDGIERHYSNPYTNSTAQ